MILKLMSWGLIFLAAVVQSAVTSAELCVKVSTDTSCSGAEYDCYDICSYPDVNCDWATCKNIAYYLQEEQGMTDFDECYSTPTGYDGIATCEDDGVPACDADDVHLCVTACLTTSGECGGDCIDHPVDLSEYSLSSAVPCETLLATIPLVSEYTFTKWCECITVNNTYDMKMKCGGGACSAGGSSNNTGMIIGIVVGAVVLVIVVVAVVICMRRRKL